MYNIHKGYLAMVPIPQLEELMTPLIGNMSVEDQMALLLLTVKHEVSMRYPTTMTYRKSFLRKLLNKLESCGKEICDEIYTEYTALMTHQDTDMTCFKTYVMPDCTLTLKENHQLVSGGTTGLCTWQASQHLAEWAMENKNLFENKCILELGSGLGFTGIVISKICQPRRFTFSDCHEQVLQKLATNIVQNLVKCVHVLDTCHKSNGQDNLIKFEEAVDFKNVQVPTKSSFSDECSDCRLTSEKLFNLCCNELYEMYWKLTPSSNSDKITPPIQVMQLKADKSIHLVRLDWEKFNGDEILKAFCEVDTIIAADVVYDPCIIPALVNTLNILLDRVLPDGGQPTAYIASTIRNPRTRDLFLESLESTGISRSELSPPKAEILFYDRSVPVQILKLQCKPKYEVR